MGKFKYSVAKRTVATIHREEKISNTLIVAKEWRHFLLLPFSFCWMLISLIPREILTVSQEALFSPTAETCHYNLLFLIESESYENLLKAQQFFFVISHNNLKVFFLYNFSREKTIVLLVPSLFDFLNLRTYTYIFHV